MTTQNISVLQWWCERRNLWGCVHILTLVLERGPDSLVDGVLDICRRVDEVEILAASLADNTRVALVDVQVGRDVLPELLENERAAGKVQGSEVWAGDCLTDDLLCGSWHELNHAGRDAGFCKDLVHDVVGVERCWGGLPEDSIAHQSRSCHTTSENTTNHGGMMTDLQTGFHQWR